MRRYGMLHVYEGEYRTTDGRYQVVRGWADYPGWTVLLMRAPGECEVLDTWRTLRQAKDDIDRCRQ